MKHKVKPKETKELPGVIVINSSNEEIEIETLVANVEDAPNENN